MQRPHRVQRPASVTVARLRWSVVVRVMIRSGQAATQRPQPEQRVTARIGGSAGIAEQSRLFPLFDHLLFLAQRIVARAGGDQGERGLLATASAAGAELVGSSVVLGCMGRLFGHGLPWRPGKFTSGQQMDVQVKHGLAGIGAVVLYQPEAALVQALFAG